MFLDRDGTITREVGVAASAGRVPRSGASWWDLALYDGVPAALYLLRRLGFLLIVVTNQASVGRGLMSEEALVLQNERLKNRFGRMGCPVDAILYCPHHPVEGVGPYQLSCDCRKPEPGLILKGARLFGIDPGRSYLVGDKISDIQAGKRAGLSTILVLTGWGRAELSRRECSAARPDAVAGNLLEAAFAILRMEQDGTQFDKGGL